MENKFVEITQSGRNHFGEVEVIDRTKLKSDFILYGRTPKVGCEGTVLLFIFIVSREDVSSEVRE